MTEDDARTILEQLARGELTPDQAEQRLGPPGATGVDEADAPGDPAAESEQESESERGEAGPQAATVRSERRIKANLSAGGLIAVLGDDTAEDAYVDGPASVSLWTEKYETRISGDMSADAVLIVPSDVELELEVSSSEATVEGFRGTLNALFNVGNARVQARLDHGESRIYANCGTLSVDLIGGSDVVITQRCAAQMKAGPHLDKTGRGQWTLGSGAGHLELAGNMGSITLNAE